MINNWEAVLIQQTATIREALELINENGLQVVVVVDEQSHLLGVVTDGDVRRAILNNLSLNEPIVRVMNKTPTTIQIPFNKCDAVELMERKSINSVPIVDGEIVVGLETLHDALLKQTYDNPIFIMAGGFGTRLRPLTDNCPKPMLKVGDKPMLETLIINFKKAGFHNFYISTHYLPEVIQDYFGHGEKHNISITYVHEETPLGTGGALGLLPDDLPELPMIMINGDVLTSINFNKILDFHDKYPAAATMCVREYDYQIPYGVVESEGHIVTSLEEKPVQRFYINAGIYIVGRELIRNVQKNKRVDMPTLLEQEISAGRNVTRYPVHEYWLDIGQMDDFKRAQIDVHALGLVV